MEKWYLRLWVAEFRLKGMATATRVVPVVGKRQAASFEGIFSIFGGRGCVRAALPPAHAPVPPDY